MVWGISTDGDSFSRVLNDSDAIALDIPNGNWTFSAVAWDSGDGTIMDNDAVRCARSTAMELDGDEVSVSLKLSGPNCNSANFRGPASQMDTILRLRVCQDTTDILTVSDECTNDAIAVNRKSGKAPIMSILVRLEEFDKFGSTAEQQGAGLSRCVAFASNLNGLWPNPTDLVMPVGDPANPSSTPFRTSFDLYPGSLDCGTTGQAAFSTVTLPHGLAPSAAGHKYFSGPTLHHLYLNIPDSLVCGSRGSLTPFAGGDGSQGHPHLICSASQLYRIHDATTDMDDSFRLMVDINLNPYSKGIAASAPACWTEGQNWQPIGYNASCAPIAGGFRGSFFGGGHTITGMRMRMDTDGVGFIGEWFPVIDGHMISGLIFDKPEVGGQSMVGVLVGHKPLATTNYSLIANVEVRGGEVAAGKNGVNSYLGGIIGYGKRANLLSLKTSRLKVEGEGSYIGGIFGLMTGNQINHKLVSRSYVGAPEWSTASYVGGIGGQISSDNLNPGQFGEWASESIVVGSQYVGGLLGDWGSTQLGSPTFAHIALGHVYAAGSITMRGQTANHLGGLFGTNYVGANLNRAYFAGSLLNDAQDPSCGGSCNIGWISGLAATLGATNVYVAEESSGGHFSILPRSGAGDAGITISARQPHNAVAPSIYDVSAMSGLLTAAWVHEQGDLPRLLFEKHPCSKDADVDGITPRMALSAQKVKWGSASKPLMICRKDQFAEIDAHLETGKIGVIVGALNLGSSAELVKPSIQEGAYLTGEGGYIHGLRRVETGGTLSWAPFDTISGTLKHLLVAGTYLKSEASANTGSSISGLALVNDGYIEDVKFLTGSIYQNNPNVVVSGLVRTNTGTMKDVSFEGTLKGGGEISGLVSINSSTIQDSEASGRLLLTIAGNDIAGVAGVNSGTIERVTVSLKFIGSSFAANYLGMVAVTNSGTIQDVHVTTEADWSGLFGANVSLIVVTQSAGSPILKRVVVEGFLHTLDNSDSYTDGDLNFVKDPLGSMTSMFVVPGGRRITEVQTSNCSSSILTVMPAQLLSSYQNSGFWNGNLLDGSNVGNVVWALVDDQDGKVTYARVVTGSYTSSLALTLDRDCSELGFPGTRRVRLVHDFNDNLAGSIGSLISGEYVGFTPGPAPYSVANLTGDWDEDIPNAPVDETVIARDTPGQEWILDIMGEFLGVTTTTTPKPIWEADGNERIELFKIKK